MERHVAFLRGMNLGGRRISNADLRGHFEALRCGSVATFRASGNVIFGRDEPPAKLKVLAIAACRPFDAELVEASKGKLQVALLEKKPRAAAAASPNRSWT